MTESICCESCSHYVYNEDWECYECLMSPDEDEYARFLSSAGRECPYYRDDDEYKLVRHQN